MRLQTDTHVTKKEEPTLIGYKKLYGHLIFWHFISSADLIELHLWIYVSNLDMSG